MSREFESYDDLFIDERTVDSLTEKKEFYENIETGLDKFSTEKKNDLLESEKSSENLNNEESFEEKYEQNHIITTGNDDFSFEADDDEESFADAADESPDGGSGDDSSGDDMDFDTGEMDMDDGGDMDMGADGDSMDGSSDESGSDGDGGIGDWRFVGGGVNTSSVPPAAVHLPLKGKATPHPSRLRRSTGRGWGYPTTEMDS